MGQPTARRGSCEDGRRTIGVVSSVWLRGPSGSGQGRVRAGQGDRCEQPRGQRARGNGSAAFSWPRGASHDDAELTDDFLKKTRAVQAPAGFKIASFDIVNLCPAISREHLLQVLPRRLLRASHFVPYAAVRSCLRAGWRAVRGPRRAGLSGPTPPAVGRYRNWALTTQGARAAR